MSVLHDRQIPVVITEQDLPLGDWKDLLEAVQYLPYGPLLIVASRVADRYLCAEVVNLGGHGVIAKPFQEAELHRVLENAWRIWKNKNKR